MVMQVLADARPVQCDRQTEVPHVRGRTDPGKEQELRRADRARGEDNLALAACASRCAALSPAHADRALALEHDVLDQTTGLEPEVLPMQHRLQESACRRPAAAVP